MTRATGKERRNDERRADLLVNEHGLVVSPPAVMYHMTERRRLQTIRREGLRPSEPRLNAPGSSNAAGVYLFAELVELRSHHLWAELKDPVVLAVDVRDLPLHGDPDWINDDFPYPNTAWYSTGAIPPSRMRRLS